MDEVNNSWEGYSQHEVQVYYKGGEWKTNIEYKEFLITVQRYIFYFQKCL